MAAEGTWGRWSACMCHAGMNADGHACACINGNLGLSRSQKHQRCCSIGDAYAQMLRDEMLSVGC
jgi:hypothetical protein